MQTKLKAIMDAAILHKASDIYIWPASQDYEVSLRVLNERLELKRLSFTEGQMLINFLKFQANMSLSEKRRPQLGSWHYLYQNQTFYCRLSSVGDFLGKESLVIRVLYREEGLLRGYFFPNQLATIEQEAQKRGLILFAGPMGSGKTTTMYHVAKQFGEQYVLCIEDPIEMYEPNFLQLQVNKKAQMGYPELLKLALRHRPDVFIIGEIRDGKTAQVALNAALSGHLVLSTVHAQSVYGVWERLRSLGVDAELLHQGLQMINYQRLLPTKDGQQRVLFDQLKMEDVKAHGKTKVMTEKWGDNLAKCYQNGWISREIWQKYQAG